MSNEFKPEDMIKKEELINGIYKYADRLEKINTIELTIGDKSKEDLIKELIQKKIIVSGQAMDLVKDYEFTTSRKQEQIKLVIISVSDLGFLKNATYSEIYEKAQKFGLEYCPAEVGPQLRLQSDKNAFLMIGMKPITDKNENQNIFSIVTGDDDERELDCEVCEDNVHYHNFDKFVFCKAKK